MLAEKTGMSESYLTHIKNSTRRWNEDILKRLADAFGVHPVEMFSVQKKQFDHKGGLGGLPEGAAGSIATAPYQNEASDMLEVPVPLMVPVMKEIPSSPSPYNNELTQITSGCKGMFVPVVGSDDHDMFCYKVDSSSFKPRFSRNDYLIVSPRTQVKSGDIVAVEYGDVSPIRTFMHVSFVDDYTILEPLNPSKRKTPVVMQRGQDAYRIIGRVVFRYQKLE